MLSDNNTVNQKILSTQHQYYGPNMQINANKKIQEKTQYTYGQHAPTPKCDKQKQSDSIMQTQNQESTKLGITSQTGGLASKF